MITFSAIKLAVYVTCVLNIYPSCATETTFFTTISIHEILPDFILLFRGKRLCISHHQRPAACPKTLRHIMLQCAPFMWITRFIFMIARLLPAIHRCVHVSPFVCDRRRPVFELRGSVFCFVYSFCFSLFHPPSFSFSAHSVLFLFFFIHPPCFLFFTFHTG